MCYNIFNKRKFPVGRICSEKLTLLSIEIWINIQRKAKF